MTDETKTLTSDETRSALVMAVFIKYGLDPGKYRVEDIWIGSTEGGRYPPKVEVRVEEVDPDR